MNRLTIACVLWICSVSPAAAYIGPGLGAGTIALVFGVLSAIILALFAVLWYPFKRLIKKRKGATVAENRSTDDKRE